MSEFLPEPHEEQSGLSVTLLMTIFDGLCVVTFKEDDTLVRTFDEPWNHMDYVYHHPEGRDRPVLFFGYMSLASRLAQIGFTDIHAQEPSPGDQDLYMEYCHRRLATELPTALEGGDVS